jgi:hypothetical protein
VHLNPHTDLLNMLWKTKVAAWALLTFAMKVLRLWCLPSHVIVHQACS